MQDIGITMIREHMENIPEITFPEGFGIRNYRPGEGHIWMRIQRAAEKFIKVEDDLFDQEFGRNLKELEDRSFFVVTDDGEEVGTITAWWSPDWRGKEWGLIHWLAIHPDYQGRGLSKPAMTVAMERLRQSHDRAFLSTSTGRIIAVKVYLDFGFYPDLEAENSQAAWEAVASVLAHPVLKEYGF
jgi:GNAT superfamily N-acetyltransferase